MSSTTLNTGTLNCWSQSGSTKKYESSLGPFISITGCGGLATSATGIIVKNWTSDSNCNYYGHIPINYSIPDGYSETSSSSGATAATISATYTLYYGNAAPSGTVSKTIYYKIDYYANLEWYYESNGDKYTITLYTNYTYVYNIKFTVIYHGSIPDSSDGGATWTVNKGSNRYKNGDIIDSGSLGDVESGWADFLDFGYDVIV